MRILGYGEDALTYWALSKQMTDVIGPPPIDDDSPSEKALFFYRPSFGRAGGAGSAQFGEFDAIIGTPKKVYLVESKWRLPIVDGQIITLAECQVTRHRVFRWLRARWLAQHPADWKQFHAGNSNATDFTSQFALRLAPPGSVLARNIEYSLQQLDAFGKGIQDVLLYFRLESGSFPGGVQLADSEPSFAVAPFVYHPLSNGGIVEMHR
jgi:hypothetical protein